MRSWREEGHLYFSCLITEEAVPGPRGLAHLYSSWRPLLEIRLQCNGDWGESTETKFGIKSIFIFYKWILELLKRNIEIKSLGVNLNRKLDNRSRTCSSKTIYIANLIFQSPKPPPLLLSPSLSLTQHSVLSLPTSSS